MKRILISILCFGIVLFSMVAQYKKDGTPDMRYKANKQQYYPNYSAPSTTTNSDVRYQQGYTKSNGTYVESHYKTNSNTTNWDNYSSTQNQNPYTGTTGSRAKDYTPAASNYGSGQAIQSGSRGGQYYINSKGNKVYVPKK